MPRKRDSRIRRDDEGHLRQDDEEWLAARVHVRTLGLQQRKDLDLASVASDSKVNRPLAAGDQVLPVFRVAGVPSRLVTGQPGGTSNGRQGK